MDVPCLFFSMPFVKWFSHFIIMVEVTCDTTRTLLHSCARKKQQMKKVIVLQLKNDDYYDGNLWALKWSKSMIALAVNDYTTIKKKKL